MKHTFLLLFLFLTSFLNAQEALYDYDVEKRLEELGIQLEKPVVPPGLKIELASQSGNLIYLSGNGPLKSDGTKIAGKVGADLTVEEGYQAARLTAINHLAVLKEKIGNLNRVVKIVKVLGFEIGRLRDLVRE